MCDLFVDIVHEKVKPTMAKINTFNGQTYNKFYNQKNINPFFKLSLFLLYFEISKIIEVVW